MASKKKKDVEAKPAGKSPSTTSSGTKASGVKTSGGKTRKSKKAKGPSLDELLVVVADTAKEAVRAGVKAQEAANKTSAKKGALKEARARAAQAKQQAARTADELAVAEAAARAAEHDEREAGKALAKAKKKRSDAESAASKAAERAGRARAELESHPAVVGVVKAVPGRVEQEDQDRAQAEEAAGLVGETLVQDAQSSDASPTAVPTELVAAESDYRPLAEEPQSVDAPGSQQTPLLSGGPAVGDPVVPDEELAAVSPDGDWTLARMRAVARERGIRGYSAMSKARLLEVLLSDDPQRPTLV